MKNNNFSLNDGVIKKNSYFFAEISMLSRCKLKNLFKFIKSLIHAVATLNLNMHIKFQVNWIISMGVLYNGDFKNMVSRKMRLKFDNMFKVQHKKNSISILNQLSLGSYKHPFCSS